MVCLGMSLLRARRVPPRGHPPGPSDLLAQLTKRLLERAMGAKLDEHLGTFEPQIVEKGQR
jgi:hypothetical protein